MLEFEHLRRQIQSLEQQISELPVLHLVYQRCGPYIKWFQSDGKKRIYIPKSKKAWACQLAYRDYLQANLQDLKKIEIAFSHFLSESEKILANSSAEKILSNVVYQELLAQPLSAISEDLRHWQTSDFQSNPFHPEECIYRSPSGHILRSKSECMIDQALFLHDIPFRYESALTLFGKTIYPDFTIRHPINKEFIYWEHFGLMDDPSYASKAIQKIDLYQKNQISPGIHLIMSFETKEHPLDYMKVENIIHQYFL